MPAVCRENSRTQVRVLGWEQTVVRIRCPKRMRPGRGKAGEVDWSVDSNFTEQPSVLHLGGIGGEETVCANMGLY